MHGGCAETNRATPNAATSKVHAATPRRASQNKLDEATTALRHALTLEPRNAQGWYNLGWIFHRQGQRTEAEEAYRTALRHQPYMREARINLGNLLRARGQPAAAAQLLRPGFWAEGTAEPQRSSQSQK